MAKVIELYTCSICGTTLAECKNWGPICKKTGSRVCAQCCYECEHKVSWSGLWKCTYMTEEDRKAEIKAQIQERFDAESKKISDAYHAERKRKAREYAIKQAKARRKANTKGGKQNNARGHTDR